MQKIVPFLWYDGQAEEAANFYVTLLPDSRVDCVLRSPADNPSGQSGSVLTVEFTLAGQKYVGLNGGPMNKFSQAVSFQILCADQAEVDRLWAAFLGNGGKASACGWLEDRWGLSWQITPVRMMELLNGPDRGRAKRAMEAMMTMVKLDIAALEAAANGAGS